MACLNDHSSSIKVVNNAWKVFLLMCLKNFNPEFQILPETIASANDTFVNKVFFLLSEPSRLLPEAVFHNFSIILIRFLHQHMLILLKWNSVLILWSHLLVLTLFLFSNYWMINHSSAIWVLRLFASFVVDICMRLHSRAQKHLCLYVLFSGLTSGKRYNQGFSYQKSSGENLASGNQTAVLIDNRFGAQSV